MRSTGNDIVTLDLIDIQRSNDSRFYSKILTASETSLYHLHAGAFLKFEIFLWLCWSVKESAYKYLKRTDPNLRFSPVKIVIQNIDAPEAVQTQCFTNAESEHGFSKEKCYSGCFVFNGLVLYFRSRVYDELIATIVSADPAFKNIICGVQKIPDTSADGQSAAVRSFLLQRLYCFYPGHLFRIEKTDAGYPVVFDGEKEFPFAVSFAHHGQYVAFTMPLSA